MTAAADRHLLFGLLALQNGLIDQALVAACQAWTRDKSKSLADHLEARGDLRGLRAHAPEAFAAVHVETHGGDVKQSLAAVPRQPMYPCEPGGPGRARDRGDSRPRRNGQERPGHRDRW